MPSHLRRIDEPGHVHFWTISCYRRLSFFWHDDMKRVIVSGLATLQREFSICLIAYVIMPEHIHVILYPHARGEDAPIPISDLLHAFKKQTGEQCMECLRLIWRRERTLWSAPLNRWARNDFKQRVIWTTRGYDFNITRQDTLIEKINYCHKNPLTRGLVDCPEQWAFSSYRFYELDDRSVLAMDWDGAWPIRW